MIRDDLNPLEQQTRDYEPLYPPIVESERGPGPVLAAVLRRWYLVLIPMLLLAGAAYALSEQRDPTYTAEARLNVGGFNITAESLPGFAGGAYLLSGAYSRAAYGDDVLNPVSRRLGITPLALANALDVSPVKDSPIIRVSADSTSAGRSVAMANLTADALQRHARTLARTNPDSQRLFADFKRAAADLRKAEAAARLARRHHRGVSRAETTVELAQLRKNSVAGLYQTSLGGQATTNAVQLIAPARDAKSDASSYRARLLAAGLLGGFAIGFVIAYLAGRRRVPGRFYT
jgi:hypothetical protein